MLYVVCDLENKKLYTGDAYNVTDNWTTFNNTCKIFVYFRFNGLAVCTVVHGNERKNLKVTGYSTLQYICGAYDNG